MTGSQGWRLAERTGRALLLGAVAFWWGAVVAPQLISISFPSLLPWDALPRQLNPDAEESVANTVSAALLLIVALLALLAAWLVLTVRNWPAVWGWLTLSGLAVYVAWDEAWRGGPVRGWFLPTAGDFLFGWLGIEGRLVLNSLLILAFTLAMVAFAWKGITARDTRLFVTVGLACWIGSVFYDEAYRFTAPTNWTYSLYVLIEETLEFSGALLFGLAAATNLAKRQEAAMPFRKAALGAAVIVALLGGAIALDAVRLHRELLVDTRGEKVFSVVLWEGERSSLTQEIGTLPPTGRLRLRAAADGESAELVWRLRSGPNIVREGRVTVPARAEPQWFNIDFPPVVMDNPLSVQLVSGDNMRIGGTKTRELDHLQFRVNGVKTWPDQKLELTAYGPSDLTLDKLQAIWRNFKWTWPVLGVTSIFGLWIITFIPALLVSAALRRRP